MAAARKAKTVAQEDSGPREYPITVEQVMKLEIGCRVNLHGEDVDGNHRWMECTVAGHSGQKFLTYRHNGQLKRCPIKEYPSKYYTKVV